MHGDHLSILRTWYESAKHAPHGRSHGKAQDMKAQTVAMANTTIHNLASAALWLFVLSLLSLLATLGGGALGIADNTLSLPLSGRPVMRPAHAPV